MPKVFCEDYTGNCSAAIPWADSQPSGADNEICSYADISERMLFDGPCEENMAREIFLTLYIHIYVLDSKVI